MSQNDIKVLLEACKYHQQRVAKHPMLEEMKLQRIPATERFSSIDVFLYMAFTFADINNHLLYQPGASNPYQQAINKHAKTDGSHWKYLIKDINTLGLNKIQTVEATCLQLWSSETVWIRKYMYSVLHQFGCAHNYVLKLAFMLGNESTVELFFEQIVHAAHRYEQQTGNKLHYPSDTHLESEAKYPFDVDAFATLEFDTESTASALEMIKQHFKDFEIFMNGKWAWTQKRMAKYI